MCYSLVESQNSIKIQNLKKNQVFFLGGFCFCGDNEIESHLAQRQPPGTAESVRPYKPAVEVGLCLVSLAGLLSLWPLKEYFAIPVLLQTLSRNVMRHFLPKSTFLLTLLSPSKDSREVTGCTVLNHGGQGMSMLYCLLSLERSAALFVIRVFWK